MLYFSTNARHLGYISQYGRSIASFYKHYILSLSADKSLIVRIIKLTN